MQKIVDEQGLELIQLDYTPAVRTSLHLYRQARRSNYCRLQKVSRDLSGLLDAYDLIAQSYILESLHRVWNALEQAAVSSVFRVKW